MPFLPKIPKWSAGFAALILLGSAGPALQGATVSAPETTVSAQVNESNGSYEIVWAKCQWRLAGHLPAPLKNVAIIRGHDAIGGYQELGFDWLEGQAPMTGWLRVYDKQSVVLFSDTCTVAAATPPAPFPNFTKIPTQLHIFSHSLKEFAVPQFSANEISTPWLLFDDQANAFLISPATNFFIASMQGDGKGRIASGFNPNLRELAAGFTHQTLLSFGAGINRTWDDWGKAMQALQGAKRPPYDADAILKYLGYWTDNGATYYYNYDEARGYAGTLQALVEHYRAARIPIRYLQLDSWWYSKSTTGADGSKGKAKKVEKLPEGEWNRYGGTLEYKAHPDLFPAGLAAFQKSINLPLITHGRWIDTASPYHDRYQISGVAAIDPKWWNDTVDYLKSSEVTTYEQDWCDRIFSCSPEFSSRPGVGEAFLDNMARACKERGITMQYCMAYACYFMQGSRYENLTTIRTCTDRFSPIRWNDFLYVSRLASALGIWPWADVYLSSERDNVLLSTLSAGAVGIADRMGAETKTNLLRAVREDGVIVKPDAAIVPLDRCYIADALRMESPLIASTFTKSDGVKTAYVFAFNRPKSPAGEIHFSPMELGFTGPVYIHDGFTGKAQRLDASATFSAPLSKGGTAFYIVAPVGRSGIAFLGDRDKYVATGKQRIAAIHEDTGRLAATVIFAEPEATVTLHGYSAIAPQITAQNGKLGPVSYDSTRQYFTVELQVDRASPMDTTSGDPVRRMTVVMTIPSKLAAAPKG